VFRICPAFIALFAVSCISHSCPAYPYVDALQALRDNASTHKKVAAIQAEARVDQRGKKGRVRGTVLMFAERPNRVRIDAMTQFGPAAMLTADGGRFAFTDLKENRYLEGETCPYNIARFLGVRLSAEQATALLLGETLLPEGIESVKSSVGCTSEGNYLITLRTADGKLERIVLAVADGDLEKPPAQQRLRLTQAELFAKNAALIWRVSYDDYRTVRHADIETQMPFSIRIEQPAIESDTLLRFRQIAINPRIPPGAFSQTPPPSILKEVVPCN
jgi:hypothetical protein